MNLSQYRDGVSISASFAERPLWLGMVGMIMDDMMIQEDFEHTRVFLCVPHPYKHIQVCI